MPDPDDDIPGSPSINPFMLPAPHDLAKIMNKRRTMKAFTGSPCTQANRCKCGHFARYHQPIVQTVSNLINNQIVESTKSIPEQGKCLYCNCQQFRKRDTVKENI